MRCPGCRRLRRFCLRSLWLRRLFRRSRRCFSRCFRSYRSPQFGRFRRRRRGCLHRRLCHFRRCRQGRYCARRTRLHRGCRSDRRPRRGRPLRRHRLRRNHPRTMRLRRSFCRRTRRLSKYGRFLRRRLRRLRFMRHRVRRLHRRTRGWGRWRRRSRLLRQRLEHIAGLRNLREIDLRLELVRVRGAVPARRVLGPVLLDVLPHEYRFMLLDRAGVRLLFRHSHFRQRIEYGLAFYFQLSCQIVNSNLHSVPKDPPYCSPVLLKPS